MTMTARIARYAILAATTILLIGAPAASAREVAHVSHHARLGHVSAYQWAWRYRLPAIPLPPRLAFTSAPCTWNGEDEGTACADTVNDIVHLGDNQFDQQPLIRFHEIGHIYDVEVLTDRDRAALIPLLNRRATRWTCATDSTDPDYGDDGCPLERFADAYAECRMRVDPRLVAIMTSYGTSMNRSTELEVCAIIASAGRRAGL